MVKIKFSPAGFDSENKQELQSENRFSSLAQCNVSSHRPIKIKFGKFSTLNMKPTSLLYDSNSNAKHDSFYKKSQKSYVKILFGGHKQNSKIFNAKCFTKKFDNSRSKSYKTDSVTIREKSAKLNNVSKMRKGKVFLIKDITCKSSRLPSKSKDGFCFIREFSRSKHSSLSNKYFNNKYFSLKNSSSTDKKYLSLNQVHCKTNFYNLTNKRMSSREKVYPYKNCPSISSKPDYFTLLKPKGKFNKNEIEKKRFNYPCGDPCFNEKTSRIVFGSTFNITSKRTTKSHNHNPTHTQSKSSKKSRYFLQDQKLQIFTPGFSENTGKSVKNVLDSEYDDEYISALKIKKHCNFNKTLLINENLTIQTDKQDYSLKLTSGDTVKDIEDSLLQNSKAKMQLNNDTKNIARKRKLSTDDRKEEKPGKNISQSTSNFLNSYSICTRSRSLTDYKSDSGKGVNNEKSKVVKKIDRKNNPCPKSKKKYIEEIIDSTKGEINDSNGENESITSKKLCTSDHRNENIFKSSKAMKSSPNKEYHVDDSVVILHRNPLVEKFVSENISAIASDMSYLFPTSASEFDTENSSSNLTQNEKFEKAISNGPCLQDEITVKKEPVTHLNEFDFYGLNSENSEMQMTESQRWVLDSFGRVVVKDELTVDLLFDDTEESTDCLFEGFDDSDCHISIKHEPIDPPSPYYSDFNEDSLVRDIADASKESNIDINESATNNKYFESAENLKEDEKVSPSGKQDKGNSGTPMKLRTRNSNQHHVVCRLKSICDCNPPAVSPAKINKNTEASSINSVNKSAVSILQEQSSVTNSPSWPRRKSPLKSPRTKKSSVNNDNIESNSTPLQTLTSIKSPNKSRSTLKSIQLSVPSVPTDYNQSMEDSSCMSSTSKENAEVQEQVSDDDDDDGGRNKRERMNSPVNSEIDDNKDSEEEIMDKILYYCLYCPFATYLRSSLTTHAKLHHNRQNVIVQSKNGGENFFLMCRKRNNSYICSTCNKIFNSSGNLFRHIRVHKKGYSYQCMVCKLCFESSEKLKIHIGTAHAAEYIVKRKSYMCEKCSLKFSSAKRLHEHSKIHYNLLCPFCKVICDNESFLRSHMKTHSNKHNQYLHCSKCDFVSCKTSIFIEHIRVHESRKVSPPIEDKEKSKIELKTKNVSCMFCDKEFSSNVTLVSHLSAVHSNISSTYKPEINRYEKELNLETENTQKYENGDVIDKHKKSLFMTTIKMKEKSLSRNRERESSLKISCNEERLDEICNLKNKEKRSRHLSNKLSDLISSRSTEQVNDNAQDFNSTRNLDKSLNGNDESLHKITDKSSVFTIKTTSNRFPEKFSGKMRLQQKTFKNVNTKLKQKPEQAREFSNENRGEKCGRSFDPAIDDDKVLTRREKSRLNEQGLTDTKPNDTNKNQKQIKKIMVINKVSNEKRDSKCIESNDANKSQKQVEKIMDINKEKNEMSSSNDISKCIEANGTHKNEKQVEELVDINKEPNEISSSNEVSKCTEDNLKLSDKNLEDWDKHIFDPQLFEENVDSLLNENINTIIENLENGQDILSTSEENILSPDSKSLSTAWNPELFTLNEETFSLQGRENLPIQKGGSKECFEANEDLNSENESFNKSYIGEPPEESITENLLSIENVDNKSNDKDVEKKSVVDNIMSKSDIEEFEKKFNFKDVEKKYDDVNVRKKYDVKDVEKKSDVEAIEKKFSIEDERSDIEDVEEKPDFEGVEKKSDFEDCENSDFEDFEKNSDVEDCEKNSDVEDVDKKCNVEDMEKKSNVEDVENNSEDIEKKSNAEDVENNSAVEDIEKKSNFKDVEKKSSVEDIVKKYNIEEVKKKSNVEDGERKSSAENVEKKSEVEDIENKSDVDMKEYDDNEDIKEKSNIVKVENKFDVEDKRRCVFDNFINKDDKIYHVECDLQISKIAGKDIMETNPTIDESKSLNLGSEKMMEYTKTDSCDNENISEIDTEINENSPSINSPSKNTLNYKCSVCEFRTNKLFKLNVHLETHNDVRSQAFECSFCPETFCDSLELKIHIKTHDDDDDS